MDLEKIYYDMDGNKKNILEMVKLYPEWAPNVIQWYCEKCTDGFEGSTQITDQILTLIKEAGWKSPEEVTQLEADLDGFKHGSL